MPVKITFSMKRIRNKIIAAQKDFARRVSDKIGKVINKEIQAGKSPVRGIGRFEPYSVSYEDQINQSGGFIKGTDGILNSGKRKRPVNLTVSGKMLKTQKVSIIDGKKVRVKYTSKIASFHNEGTPKMNRRPMVPDEGEEFSRTVDKFLLTEAKKSVDKKLIKR